VPAETLVINVADRHYKDEEKELDFWIHSVDLKNLVYWTPDQGPKKMYALPFTMDSYWHEKKVLGPRPDEEGDEEDQKKIFFEHVPVDYEDLREKEYAERLKGKNPDDEKAHIKPVDLSARRNSKGARSSRSKYSSKSSSKSKYSSKSSGSKNPSSAKTVKPKSEAEQMKDLGGAVKEALNSDKTSAKEKQQLREIEKVFKGTRRK
jgi:hypothetical protein